jgi:hypothetical protein
MNVLNNFQYLKIITFFLLRFFGKIYLLKNFILFFKNFILFFKNLILLCFHFFKYKLEISIK